MNIRTRIEKLELVAVAEDEAHEIDPWWAAYYDAADALLQTLSREHAAQIIAEHEREQESGELSRSALYGWFNSCCIRQAQGRHDRPYAIPPVVCEVLSREASRILPEGNAHIWDHECEACGLELPCTWEMYKMDAAGYFDACPLCGGRVGCFLFYIRQHKEKSSVH